MPRSEQGLFRGSLSSTGVRRNFWVRYKASKYCEAATVAGESKGTGWRQQGVDATKLDLHVTGMCQKFVGTVFWG